VTPAEAGSDTWSALETALLPRLEEFGITRLADTTGLDTLSTPTASATKPGTSDVIWVYSGKGRSRAQARVTAIMECLERTGALWSDKVPVVRESERVLARTHVVWGPERFTYRRRADHSADDPQLWVEAEALRGAERVMVPADVCFNGRRPATLPPSPFLLGTSNGLAAALTTTDALRHAIFEIVERDVVSHAEVRASHAGYRFLATAISSLQLSGSILRGFVDDVDHVDTIEQGSLPDRARLLLDRYTAAGLDVVVKELPNSFGLPAFGVCAIDHSDLGRFLGCAGYAVRASSVSAVEAALLELAQTRSTDLQGAREDRHEPEKQRLTAKPESHWLATPGRDPLPFEDREVADDLSPLLDRCAEGGLTDVAFVRFPGWPGISVVRVVAPAAETWHITGGWSEMGPRLRAAIERR
jgi:ribosomal protein S12 methylthiotransferase accessory factor YcaO